MNETASFSLSRRDALRLLGAGALATLLPSPASASGTGDRPLILAATYPAWLATAAVLQGIDGYRLELLVDARLGCPHDYAMTPADRMALADAAVVVLNGAGYEAFLDDALLKGLPGLVVDAGAGLPDLGAQYEGADMAGADLFGGGHGGHDHGDALRNPHHFASPEAFKAMIRAVAAALGGRFPENAAAFDANARVCAGVLDGVTRELLAIPGSDVRLILQHDALAWFFRGTAFTVEAVLQREAAESPSPATLLTLTGRVREGGRWLLVGEPELPDDVLRILADETGAPIVALEPLASGPVDCDLTLPSSEAGRDRRTALGVYADVMRANVRILGRALASPL